MSASTLPAKYMNANGFTEVLTRAEEAEVVKALNAVGKAKMEKAITAYAQERAYVDGAKALPLLFQIAKNMEKRGLSQVQVQLVNVTAAQSWPWFKNFLNRWMQAA